MTRVKAPLPTVEEVRNRLHYDPETGEFKWKHVSTGRVNAGDKAGYATSTGYIEIRLRPYRRVHAHRLAWLMVYGEWPTRVIDHINGDRKDNRIANLRSCSHSQNMANGPKRKTNLSGYKGVSTRPDGKFTAQIMKNYKSHYLGYFNSPEEAHAAYRSAAEKLFGEFARNE